MTTTPHHHAPDGPVLTYEAKSGDRWILIGRITADPARCNGSIVDKTDDRDIIVFTNHGDHSTIERSIRGEDVASPTTRVLATEGMELLARLGDGEEYVRQMISDSGRPYVARWTHWNDPGQAPRADRQAYPDPMGRT